MPVRVALHQHFPNRFKIFPVPDFFERVLENIPELVLVIRHVQGNTFIPFRTNGLVTLIHENTGKYVAIEHDKGS